MNGVICVNKPSGFTSFDVIAKMRGITHQRKIGHTGTLDPMAKGVLILLFGNATRAADIIPNKTKRYIAKFKLGITTDTQDITGKVLSETENFSVTRQEVEDALSQFMGETEQIPPMYSAVQIDGKRLYDLARQGLEVERKPRKITVTKAELIDFDGINGMVSFTVSEGTYIRTLIHDLGAKLTTGAVMTDLTRTEASYFNLKDCISLEEAQELADKNQLETKLIATDRLFEDYPKIYLSEKQAAMFKNGIRLDANRVKNSGEGVYRVYGNEFLALAEIVNKELVIRKTFYGESEKKPKAQNGKTAVALGFFDGIHLAHRKVLSKVLNKPNPCVMTFKSNYFSKETLISDRNKAKMLKKLGIKNIEFLDFNSVKDMSPEDFVKEILVGKFNAEFVSCGYNFRFGKGAMGNAEDLKRICSQYGIKTEIADEFDFGGEAVSTTRIKSLLKQGKVNDANRLLGYNFFITGEVIHGNQIGRIYDFPTANQLIENGLFTVKFGVYASLVHLGKTTYFAVTNVGIKPTVKNDKTVLSETCLLDYDGDLYGKNIKVELIEFIREEVKFQDVSALASQIEKDKMTACDLLTKGGYNG